MTETSRKSISLVVEEMKSLCDEIAAIEEKTTLVKFRKDKAIQLMQQAVKIGESIVGKVPNA